MTPFCRQEKQGSESLHRLAQGHNYYVEEQGFEPRSLRLHNTPSFRDNMILSVWSLNGQHQLHLGIIRNAKFKKIKRKRI